MKIMHYFFILFWETYSSWIRNISRYWTVFVRREILLKKTILRSYKSLWKQDILLIKMKMSESSWERKISLGCNHSVRRKQFVCWISWFLKAAISGALTAYIPVRLMWQDLMEKRNSWTSRLQKNRWMHTMNCCGILILPLQGTFISDLRNRC